MKPTKSNILKSPIERRIVQLVIATGVASVVTQLVLVREFLAQFQGNELIIAIILFNWLALGGAGTRLAQAGASSGSSRLLAHLSFFLAFLAVFQIMAVRLLRPALFTAGMSVGFYPILIFSLLTMAPYALLVGYLLPFSLKVIRRHGSDYPGVGIYMADNLGDMCGGALFTFALVSWAKPVPALCLSHLPLVAIALSLCPLRRDRIIALFAVSLTWGLAFWGETPSIAPPVGRLTTYNESRFGRLVAARDQELTTLYADGRPVASSQNQMAAEQIIHYPLAQVAAPKRVLLVGASGGLLEQIAKYHPEQVDYVELDPAVTGLMFDLKLENPGPEVRTVIADGRSWLQHSEQFYDAIIVNVPEPDTFQLNRFFTDSFFELAAGRLTPDGVFSFSVEGAANFLTQAQQDKLSSLRVTAGKRFRHVLLLPGERVFFICRQRPVSVDIPEKLAAANIVTRFVAAYFHGEITPERIAALERVLDLSRPVNRDMQPFLMRVATAQWFTKFGSSPGGFIAVLAVIAIVYLFRMRGEEYVLFSTGLLVMGFEMVLIFAFQIFLGYIYSKIGLLVTAFLAGLLPGAWLGRYRRYPVRHLMIADSALIALTLAITVCFYSIGTMLPAHYYFAAGFFVSLICGYQVPLALQCLGDDAKAASRIFSVDLVGAALGALATGTVLIPYTGIGGAVGVLIGMKVISVLVMGGRYVRH